MIVEGYSGKGGKDKDTNRVLFRYFRDVYIPNARDSAETVVLGIDFVVDGADINPV